MKKTFLFLTLLFLFLQTFPDDSLASTKSYQLESNFSSNDNPISIHELILFQNEIYVASKIIASYEEKFTLLEEEAKLELDELVTEAIADYESKRNNDERISYLYFYRTYYRAAQSLENEIDTRFQHKYDQLQEELTANGLSPDKSIHFKKTYEKLKNKQKNSLMSIVKEMI
ncbi:hypothetical protein ACERII_16450 [Evansella sp. AB-rgal1]|uniref:hypothetical protein n=1 Tax=Evansella sp. AB-rgal1 TaxID=3242696 RepID=UPI00359E4636